jgi:drug/metabolite transporter (DMT)-like permease
LIGGIALYTIGTLIWAYSLRFEALSKAIVIFSVLNLILVVLAGLILFGEKLSLLTVIGIVLGAISVVLLQL